MGCPGAYSIETFLGGFADLWGYKEIYRFLFIYFFSYIQLLAVLPFF